ncbi:MAG: S49 family peptidase, partial [Nanoarchaeota archaeon]
MKKKHGILILVVAICVIVLGVVSIVTFFGTNSNQKNKIAVINIKGAISTENGGGDFLRSGTIGSGSVVGFIESANNDKNVKAIILNINSPGGTVVGSKEIVDSIKKVNKPVVALIREVGASGAYWIASASDIIVAETLSVTGSIGVIGSYLEFSDLFSE